MQITELPAHALLQADPDAWSVVSRGDDGDARAYRRGQSGAQRDRQPARWRYAARRSRAARPRVEASPARQIGGLHGLPQAIKDAAQTAGLRTTFGSPLLRDQVPARDGLMVERMKAAGCIVIGKTNTPEFGLGSHTFNEVFGVTRNAYDRSSRPVAAAAAPPSRWPADARGGRWQRLHGQSAQPGGVEQRVRHATEHGPRAAVACAGRLVQQFGTEGPMGRTVRDVALLLDVQAGETRACRSRSRRGSAMRSHSTVSTRTACASAGSATWRVTWRPSPAFLKSCDPDLRDCERCGCAVERWRPASLRRGVAGLVEAAALAGRGAPLALARESGEPIADQARSAVGSR